MSDAYLITGIPGFIGTRLVRRLLPQRRRLFLLCEQRFKSDTEQVIAQLEREGVAEPGQLVAVAGDITQDQLGFSAEDLARVQDEVSDLYHLAAVYDLAVPEELARKVNVLGTGKILRFLRESEGKVRHHYISTCYVAGSREGMIFEDELDRGQSFKNHYESTKFAAEVLVERSKSEVDTRVFRPAIVIGDSRTGETAKFDGPYPTFGAIMMGWLVFFPGSGQAPVNLVPVDFVIDCLAQIPQQPDTAGKTFQLADPNPLTAEDLCHLVAERLGAPKPRIKVPSVFFSPLLKIKQLSELTGITPQAFAYFDHNQVFDTTNVNVALRGTDVSCPPLRSYLNQILRYYRDHHAGELPWRLDRPA